MVNETPLHRAAVYVYLRQWQHDKIVINNVTKEKIRSLKKFLHEFHLKGGPEVDFVACYKANSTYASILPMHIAALQLRTVI